MGERGFLQFLSRNFRLAITVALHSRQKIDNHSNHSVPGLYLIPSEKMSRHWELDFARGIALIGMVFYHFIFDLIKVFNVPSFVNNVFWIIGPDLIGGSFLMIAGIASFLQTENNDISIVRRGGKIFGAGMFLTFITLAFTTNHIIVFGILHCIGASILLGPSFVKLPPVVLASLAIPILISGYFLEYLGYYSASVQWIQENLLGGRRMLDFFSLFPFFGYYLLGIYIGKNFWHSIHGKYQFIPAFRPITQIGKWSLWIYLIHQPILVVLIYIWRKAFV